MESLLEHLKSWTALIDGVSLIAVVTGVAKAFEWFDGMVNDEGRQALTNQLKNYPTDERIDSWATVFPNLIDRVFGTRVLSPIFLMKSFYASMIAIILVRLVYLRFLIGYLTINAITSSILSAVIFTLGTSFIPDYFSLLVSRKIVNSIGRDSSIRRIVLLLLCDTAATTLLAWFACALGILTLPILAPSYGADNVHDIWLSSLITGKGYGPAGFDQTEHFANLYTTTFYSAYFTSIWLWLYILSIFCIKVLHKVRRIWVKVMPYLDIERKPLVAIGRVAGLLAGVGYALILGIVWAVHHWI